MKWIISQLWTKVLFINIPIPKETLRPLLPSCFEMDLYGGEAYVSIVPFQMSHVRFPFSPTLPFSKLWELNLRTYIRYKNHSGIYFFTLDTDHRLAQWIAKSFFHLPYRYRKLSANINESCYEFFSPNSLSLKASLDKERTKNQRDCWLVERYSLFTINKRGEILRGDVNHPPWELREASILSLENSFSTQFDMPLSLEQSHSFYSDSLAVSFKPFSKVGQLKD